MSTADSDRSFRPSARTEAAVISWGVRVSLGPVHEGAVYPKLDLRKALVILCPGELQRMGASGG